MRPCPLPSLYLPSLFQVVPTSYKYLRGSLLQTNQFSVTEHFRPIVPGTGASLPGIFFFYDLSPIKVGSVDLP